MTNENSVPCNCGTAEKEEATASKSESNAVLRCCMKQKLWSMLRNKQFSDVCFIVGCEGETQKIYAHKAVLSASTTVFEAMFSKKWSSKSNTIEVPDIEPFVFSSILRFIYIDDVQLTADTLMKVLYAARKYAIIPLEDRCANFPIEQICPKKVCSLLTQARLFDQPKLVESCLSVIDKNSEDVFMSDSFTTIDLAALRSILIRDSLKIPEVDLFKAVLRWSATECERKSLPLSPENQKLVLEGSTSLIRFPSMTQEEFTSSVVPYELLTNEEVIDMYVYFSKNSKSPSSCDDTTPSSRIRISKRQLSRSRFSETQFSKKPRKGTKMQIFVRSEITIIPLEVESFDTIESVKCKIEAENGIQPKYQHLFFAEKEMEAGSILLDYNIQKGSIIKLVVIHETISHISISYSDRQRFLASFLLPNAPS